ncbi:MAG: nucleotidyl transferase AbiEii/AbiGii toxin family protein [Desulfobacterales bacterium]|jgi:hypothetical protein|nr:nucleotidyl transferase AbiEii/AbiGii toxin family protein [Desulfobacterales bacterium]
MGQSLSHIALMTALDYHEIATQVQRELIESVAIKRTKELSLNGCIFRYPKIRGALFGGFIRQQGVFIATPEKAFVDAAYLMSFGRYALVLAAIDAKKLNRKEVARLSRSYPLKTRKPLEKLDILGCHEVFEIEVLAQLNNAKLLGLLVFGGDTMLRLCHELNRYSVDLDFWFIRKIPQRAFFNRLLKTLGRNDEITDAQIKHFTLLIEVRTGSYPKRLKIEIRREEKECDFQAKIVFSHFSTKQVLLQAHTLEQTMKNKIEALLDRG